MLAIRPQHRICPDIPSFDESSPLPLFHLLPAIRIFTYRFNHCRLKARMLPAQESHIIDVRRSTAHSTKSGRNWRHLHLILLWRSIKRCSTLFTVTEDALQIAPTAVGYGTAVWEFRHRSSHVLRIPLRHQTEYRAYLEIVGRSSRTRLSILLKIRLGACFTPSEKYSRRGVVQWGMYDDDGFVVRYSNVVQYLVHDHDKR